jgi:hypothetical protein
MWHYVDFILNFHEEEYNIMWFLFKYKRSLPHVLFCVYDQTNVWILKLLGKCLIIKFFEDQWTEKKMVKHILLFFIYSLIYSLTIKYVWLVLKSTTNCFLCVLMVKHVEISNVERMFYKYVWSQEESFYQITWKTSKS